MGTDHYVDWALRSPFAILGRGSDQITSPRTEGDELTPVDSTTNGLCPDQTRIVRDRQAGRSMSRIGVLLAVALVALACGPSDAADRGEATNANTIDNAPPPTLAASPTPSPTTTPGEVETLEPTPPLEFPDDAGLIDVTSYGAVGDGTTDDTEALQLAIAENVGRHRILFFPPGTYLVNDSLEWRNAEGEWQPYLTLQGAGRQHTTIRLADGAPGFGDSESPQGLIVTASALNGGDPYSGGKDWPELGEGNQAFRNYIFDLTVETGSDNPGAIGIDYLGNNISGIENVLIRSNDLTGRAGLSMTRKWPGPSLIKNVEIQGFDYGIDVAHTEYGITFEDIVLRDQQLAGIRNQSNVLSMHRVRSINQVPAVQNEIALGLVVLINAELSGAGSGKTAIENAGAVYLRSVVSDGYAALLEGIDGTSIDEYAAPLTDALGGTSLMLPIEDPPPIPAVPLDQWTAVTDEAHAGGADPGDEEDDTAAIQAALDSGAPVVYFPSSGDPWLGRYLVSQTLVVPDHVERIVGFESLVLGARGSVFTQERGTVPVFRIVGKRAEKDLTVDGLRLSAHDEPMRAAVWFEHQSSRTLAFRHVQAGGGSQLAYRATDGAGRLFLEDFCCGALEFGAEQPVWARQLDVEKPLSPMVLNAGAQLWILGLKTEGPFTIITATGDGSTELLGGLLYPVDTVPTDTAAFFVDGATASFVYAVSAYVDDTRNYTQHVSEPPHELTEDETIARVLGSIVPLYRSR